MGTIFRWKLTRGQLVRGEIDTGVIGTRGNCPGGNCPGGNCPVSILNRATLKRHYKVGIQFTCYLTIKILPEKNFPDGESYIFKKPHKIP